MPEHVQSRPYTHHRVEEFATACVQGGARCDIKDADRPAVRNQDVGVIGYLGIEPFSIPTRTPSQTRRRRDG